MQGDHAPYVEHGPTGTADAEPIAVPAPEVDGCAERCPDVADDGGDAGSAAVRRRAPPARRPSPALAPPTAAADSCPTSSGSSPSCCWWPGNETTRNAISHGIVALLQHPDQWELYKRERPERPRTRSCDGRLYYAAANFGPEVFDDRYRFDITRDPNPQLGFGGTGAHYCIGANLARVEINLIFSAIADVLPDIGLLGDPKRLRSGWLNGIKELRTRYTASVGCPVAH